MNKFSYAIWNNVVLILGIAGLYAMTGSLWSFLLIIFITIVTGKDEKEDKEDDTCGKP